MTTPDAFVFDPEVESSRRHLRLILGALMLTMLLAALDQTIVSTALPTITSDLGGLNAAVLGRHGLPPRLDREHADLGQALRPLRPQAHAADRRSSCSSSARRSPARRRT